MVLIVTDNKTRKLREEGKSLREIAERFGVSKVAVWKRLKAIERTTAQILSSFHPQRIKREREVERMIGRQLSIIDQLSKTNASAHEFPDVLMA